MKESYFVEIELPKLALKQRDLFISLLMRMAAPLSFQGLEDWTIDLSSSQKVLGAAEEFHDLTKTGKVSRMVRAHFLKKGDAQTLTGLLGKLFDGLKISRPKKLGKKDWMKEWRKHYKIQWIEEKGQEIAIVPAWLKTPKNSVSVRIHPGQAFGTGTHATTRLCLRAFLGAARKLSQKKIKVLDFGAGTGILVMAAENFSKEKGVAFSGVAIESDSDALEQCKKNIRMNHSQVKAVKNMPAGKFHFVFANVLAPVLIEHQKALLGSVDLGGYIVLSGLLKKELKSFSQKFRTKGFVLEAKMIEKEWAALLYQRVQ